MGGCCWEADPSLPTMARPAAHCTEFPGSCPTRVLPLESSDASLGGAEGPPGSPSMWAGSWGPPLRSAPQKAWCTWGPKVSTVPRQRQRACPAPTG